jgi:hypothetical protein
LSAIWDQILGLYLEFNLSEWLARWKICISNFFSIIEKALEWKIMVHFKAIWYFKGRLPYFLAIWYSLWQFGIICGHLVYFSPFWYVARPKIWQPCVRERFGRN